MSSEFKEKTLKPSERRYIARPHGDARRRTYGVYDRQTASWPVFRPGFQRVIQDAKDPAVAEAEADRLEASR